MALLPIVMNSSVLSLNRSKSEEKHTFSFLNQLKHYKRVTAMSLAGHIIPTFHNEANMGISILPHRFFQLLLHRKAFLSDCFPFQFS